MNRSRSTLTCLAAAPACLLAACGGCDSTISISAPERGAMISGGAPVQISGRAEADQVTLAGQTIATEGGDFTASVPAADGLGFVAASAGEDVAVRAWHQGSFLAPDELQGQTLRLRLGPAALAGPQGSLAAALESMLAATELALLIDEPILVSAGFALPVEVLVTQASVGQFAVTLTPQAGRLALRLDLTDIAATYITQSPCVALAGSVGYSDASLTGALLLTPTGASLTDLSIALGPASASDNGLPPELLAAVLEASAPTIEALVADAASDVSTRLVQELLSTMRPAIGGPLADQLAQDWSLEAVTLGPEGLDLTYASRIQALAPRVARPGQGVLARQTATTPDARGGLQALVGRPLVNQLAFALWDAGLLEGLLFSKDRLEELGLPSLEFPYSKLRTAGLRTWLPPLLEFDAAGAWLELGGIEILLHVDTVEDTTALTACRVPVLLALDDDQTLRLRRDDQRSVTIREVEFDQLNVLASRDKILTLMESALDGVVASIFGQLAAIELSGFAPSLPDGGAGPALRPQVVGLERDGDAWRLELALAIGPVPAHDLPDPQPAGELGVCPSAFQTALAITTPARGAMLAGADPVTVSAVTDAASLTLAGVPLLPDGAGRASVAHPAVDGLGFTTAQAGDRVAVRAWHQGQLLAPAGWHVQTVRLLVGGDALTDGPASLAGLVQAALASADLASYMDPIQFNITVGVPPFSTTVPVTTTVRAAHASSIAVELHLAEGQLGLRVSFDELDADYTAVAAGVFNVSGTAHYDYLTVTGDLQLTPASAELVDVTVDSHLASISGLPASYGPQVQAAVEQEVEDAVAEAAAAIAASYSLSLIRELRPLPGLAFPRSLTQDARPLAVAPHSYGLALDYETRIVAAAPRTAQAGDGVLARPALTAPSATSQVLTATGSPLLNQLLFAAWDAGNFAGLAFDAAELQAYGMPPLAFPFNLMEGASLDLLLPPLVEWAADGAWLDVGGVALRVAARGVPDTLAWTAARLPVRLVQVPGSAGRQLRLELDAARAYEPHPVELDQLSPFVAPSAVLALIEAAAPAAIALLLARQPLVDLPSFTVPALAGGPAVTLVTRALGIAAASDHFLIEARLERQ